MYEGGDIQVNQHVDATIEQSEGFREASLSAQRASAPRTIAYEVCGFLQDKWTGEVVELSWQPRAFLFKKFMTDEECEHVIAKVRSQQSLGFPHRIVL